MSKEPRKRIRDTKVGQWLLNSAPKVLDVVGDALPDTGVMGVVKNLVDRDPNVTHEQRMELENLITSERIALEAELTKRWQSDNASDSWLAKAKYFWNCANRSRPTHKNVLPPMALSTTLNNQKQVQKRRIAPRTSCSCVHTTESPYPFIRGRN